MSHKEKMSSLDFDPYEVLELDPDNCEEKDVKRAFRKMGLKWHPDKNPDRKELAQKKFLQLTAASEILTDPAAKAALDRMRHAKVARQASIRKMDEKRRKLANELLEREKQFADKQQRVFKENDEEIARRQLEREIARLRKEGSRLVEMERERLEKEIHQNDPKPTTSRGAEAAPQHFRLRAKWKNADDYDMETLETIFQKYGVVSAVAVGSKKKSAIIEFSNRISAENAVSVETGVDSAPITVSWLSKPSEQSNANGSNAEHDAQESGIGSRCYSSRCNSKTQSKYLPLPGKPTPEAAQSNPKPPYDPHEYSSNRNLADFESTVLRNMRVAQERRELMEKMMQEEGQKEES